MRAQSSTGCVVGRPGTTAGSQPIREIGRPGNNLTSIQDANHNTTSFTYDAFGRVTKTTFPSGYIETYAYDADNNLTAKTDRKNQQITYTYDQLNRLTGKTYPDSTTVNYTYDLDSR